MTPFIIIFEGRTGSSHLVSMLNEHPDILCYEELLVNLSAADQQQLLGCIARGDDISRIEPQFGLLYSGDRETKLRSGPFAASGLKTKLTDTLHLPKILLLLRDHQFRLIHLSRRNVLKSVVSRLNAKRLRAQFGGSNARFEDEIRGPITIDLAVFDRELQRRLFEESLHRWFYDLYHGSKITLAYEDMLADKPAFMQRVFEFLGLHFVETVGIFHKNTPDQLRNAVVNYTEFAAFYKNSEFERFLD